MLPGGCDVRDEVAQDGAVSPWPPQIVDRLATPSQRSPNSPAAPRTIDFVDGYAAGSRRAAEAGLPMVLVFRASWCRWSDTFVAKIPFEPQLASLAGRFMCVSIDADRDQATCRSFGVQAFPTAIVLDRERREVYRASGATAREGLAVAVESVLADPSRRVAGRPATTPR
jgi:thiol-disulfide isomerase/thioredoxin